MSRLSEKQLLVLTITITVLLCGGLGWLIYSDLQAIEEEEATIARLREQIRSAEVEIAKIEGREFRVIANREMANKEVEFLPAEDDIETFWEVLEQYAEESGIQISAIAPTGSKKKAKGPIQRVPQLLSVRGTVDEFLRFINAVENHDRIINVLEYAITAGKNADREDPTKVRHNIKLALTTFTYSKKIANTIVSIPQYEKKRTHPEVARWRSKIKIQEKETYALRTSLGRRDPFISARRKIEATSEEDEMDRKRVEAIIERLVERLRTLELELDIEDELRERKDIFRLTQQVKDNRESFHELQRDIDQVKKEKLIRNSELSERFRKEVVAPFEDVRQRVKEGDDSQPPMPLVEVKQRFEEIANDFDERNWEAVRKKVRGFMDLTRDGDHVVEEARPIVEKIADLLRRSKVIKSFEKRKIEISAIIFSPNGLSLAIINGKTKSEGDALDADGRVVIAEVGEDFVIFETEGVEIKKLKGE
ncbi:MAG: type 4a pilus biogenesis protein PilO [Planctomycetota bacterium]